MIQYQLARIPIHGNNCVFRVKSYIFPLDSRLAGVPTSAWCSSASGCEQNCSHQPLPRLEPAPGSVVKAKDPENVFRHWGLRPRFPLYFHGERKAVDVVCFKGTRFRENGPRQNPPPSDFMLVGSRFLLETPVTDDHTRGCFGQTKKHLARMCKIVHMGLVCLERSLRELSTANQRSKEAQTSNHKLKSTAGQGSQFEDDEPQRPC